MQILDALDDANDFHDCRLVSRVMTEIRVDGILDGVPPREHGGFQVVQIGPPLCKRRRPIAQKGGALKGENALEPSYCQRGFADA